MIYHNVSIHRVVHLSSSLLITLILTRVDITNVLIVCVCLKYFYINLPTSVCLNTVVC